MSLLSQNKQARHIERRTTCYDIIEMDKSHISNTRETVMEKPFRNSQLICKDYYHRPHSPSMVGLG